MSSDLYKIIADFPKQFAIGIQAGREAKLSKQNYRNVDAVIVCGMGGSALPGDIIKGWNKHDGVLRLPIFVHKNYRLPRLTTTKNSKPLVICISYSGTTEETVSAYHAAKKANLPRMVIASGGELIRLAQKDRIPHAIIPGGVPPRFAVGYQFGALLSLLEKAGLARHDITQRVIRETKQLNTRAMRTRAREIAPKLFGKIPLIYASASHGPLTYIFKIEINENVKIPAFAHVFPELNHNEFNSFATLSPRQRQFARRFAVIMLRDQSDTPEIKKRMILSARFMRRAGTGVIETTLKGNSFFTKTFNGLILGQWIATDLAAYCGVDPLPTTLIEQFKKEMGK